MNPLPASTRAPSSQPAPSGHAPSGTAYALLAYGSWGLFPIFWKQLSHLNAVRVVSHRMVWSFVALGLLLIFRNGFRGALVEPFRKFHPKLAASAFLISTNWFTYLYGVNTGQIVETSLGYFINPLMNVALGAYFFNEKLTRRQALALSIAGAGVLWMTLKVGHFPWIALVLALTFACYGVLRKQSPVPSGVATFYETAVLFPFALALLMSGVWIRAETGVESPLTALDTALLLSSGLLTALPLIWFGIAAQRMPYSRIGLFQYIAPSIQFLIGVLLYKEPFDLEKGAAFFLIWIACAVFLWRPSSKSP